MPIIKILHLSDLHWTIEKATDMRIVIQALCDDLRHLRSSENIKFDMMIFSGDLVQSGENQAVFIEAYTEFLGPVLIAADLPRERLFIAAGNHDIARSVVRENDILEQGLRSKLVSIDSVNLFTDELSAGKSINMLAVDRLTHFNNFIDAYNPANVTNSPLLRTHVLNLESLNIGVACFNTAWRATGEANNVDRHHLIIGERHVDKALADLGATDLRIAIFHHPLEWLADFDEVAVSTRLFSGFDVLFYGHTHRTFPEARTTPIGSSLISQVGCIFQHRDHFNGYQILTLDTDASEADFIIRSYYNNPRRAFDKASNIAPEGRLSVRFSGRSVTPGAQRVERVLRSARRAIRHMAAEQTNMSEMKNDARLEAKEAFICPPLTLKRNAHLSTENESKESDTTIEALLRESTNTLFTGQRETGKSSLAHYSAVLCAEGISDRSRIPVVLDFRILKRNKYGLRRAIGAYLGGAANANDIDNGLSDGDFIFFVDNFSGHNSSEKNDFSKLIGDFSLCRWMCFANSRSGILNSENNEDVLPGFRSVYIQPLPRKSIRELSRRWCVQNGRDSDRIFITVMNHLTGDNLPRTGYMVTLLLWAIYQDLRFERINEAVLLTNMVDFLLGKADFEQALSNKFDPLSKEITLQALALHLRQQDGFSNVNDVTEYLISFFRQKGLTHSASDVLEKLIECGILARVENDISFKYPCFQDYFIACLLRDDRDALNDKLKGFTFIEYAREIDLLSGLRRRNSDLIAQIGATIQQSMPADVKKQLLHSFDAVADAESTIGLTRQKLADIQRKQLTADQIDDLMDVADRKIKKGKSQIKLEDKNLKTIEISQSGEVMAIEPAAVEMSFGHFMISVDLFGRIVKNSDFTDIDEKLPACRLYFQLTGKIFILFTVVFSQVFAELEKQTGDGVKVGERTLTPDDILAARFILSQMSLLGLQLSNNDNFASENLITAYHKIIDDKASTSIEKILATMLLLDVGDDKWFPAWTKLIDENSKRRFVLDVLTEKIWRLIHSRAFPDNEREKLGKIALKIEQHVGIPKGYKSQVIAEVRRAADETAKRETKLMIKTPEAAQD